MNCITDFSCDYHSKYGLIESVNIISINDEDCAIHIFSNKSLIRTSIVNVKILRKPHEKIYEINKIDTRQNLILSIDNYSCIVKAIKIHDDETIEVMPTSDLLLDNELSKRVSIDNLSICGEYETFDSLKSISIPMPVEYSRYFNNISIFKPLLLNAEKSMIQWNVDELKLKVLSFDEASLRKIEFLMPVFISQLSVLLCGKPAKINDMLSNYIVWEYQYENEEEANYAIGPKGSHILAVRNFKGIAGVVLTKSNRLRIIAENKYALKEARQLLEIRRESYMFDDSFIPILIGKNANHITELVTKAGLHCIHVPNAEWTGVVNAHVTFNEPSMLGKRELLLFGTKDSITSARLLLEMEESVKDLKREFEQRKHSSRLRRHSFSLKSSSSSVSKDDPDKHECEDALEVPGVASEGQSEATALWADTQDDSGPEETRQPSDVSVSGAPSGSAQHPHHGGVYTDFFSSQSSNARNRRVKKTASGWNQHGSAPLSGDQRQQHQERQERPPASSTVYNSSGPKQQNQQFHRTNQKKYPAGATGSGGPGCQGLLFTNSLSASEEHQNGPQQYGGGVTRHPRNGTHRTGPASCHGNSSTSCNTANDNHVGMGSGSSNHNYKPRAGVGNLGDGGPVSMDRWVPTNDASHNYDDVGEL